MLYYWKKKEVGVEKEVAERVMDWFEEEILDEEDYGAWSEVRHGEYKSFQDVMDFAWSKYDVNLERSFEVKETDILVRLGYTEENAEDMMAEKKARVFEKSWLLERIESLEAWVIEGYECRDEFLKIETKEDLISYRNMVVKGEVPDGWKVCEYNNSTYFAQIT